MDTNNIVWTPYVFQQGARKSFGAKLVVKQRRHVLVQRILASQHPEFESFGPPCMERKLKGSPTRPDIG